MGPPLTQNYQKEKSGFIFSTITNKPQLGFSGRVIGRFHTLFRESVKTWNFDKMFGDLISH